MTPISAQGYADQRPLKFQGHFKVIFLACLFLLNSHPHVTLRSRFCQSHIEVTTISVQGFAEWSPLKFSRSFQGNFSHAYFYRTVGLWKCSFSKKKLTKHNRFILFRQLGTFVSKADNGDLLVNVSKSVVRERITGVLSSFRYTLMKRKLNKFVNTDKARKFLLTFCLAHVLSVHT